MIDNTDQILKFVSVHRPSVSLNTSTYYKQRLEWIKTCPLERESNHCRELASGLNQTTHELVTTIQSLLDNTHIRYGYCILGLILLTYPFFHFDISSLSPFSVIFLILYLTSFTSYSLIIHPGVYPASIACMALLPSLIHSPLNTSFIILSILASLIHPSSSLISLSTWILLMAPLFDSSSILSPFQVLMQAIHLFNPSLTLPAIIACFCCVFQPSSLPSLMLLFVDTQYSYSLLCLMITSYFVQKLPLTSLTESIAVLSIALHFTYCTTPTFSFSSLHWSAAFVLTHSTRMTIQAGSMIFSVFYPFLILMRFLPKQYSRFILMLQVWVTSISTLYNTASPVIWSVFTPLLLFMIVLWSTSLLLLFVSYVDLITISLRKEYMNESREVHIEGELTVIFLLMIVRWRKESI